jgi:hypothetical protein
MYSNDEKTGTILIYGECNKNAIDVYVKFTKLHSSPCFMFFLNKKQISMLTVQMYFGLHFQFCRAHYHS